MHIAAAAASAALQPAAVSNGRLTTGVFFVQACREHQRKHGLTANEVLGWRSSEYYTPEFEHLECTAVDNATSRYECLCLGEDNNCSARLQGERWMFRIKNFGSTFQSAVHKAIVYKPPVIQCQRQTVYFRMTDTERMVMSELQTCQAEACRTIYRRATEADAKPVAKYRLEPFWIENGYTIDVDSLNKHLPNFFVVEQSCVENYATGNELGCRVGVEPSQRTPLIKCLRGLDDRPNDTLADSALGDFSLPRAAARKNMLAKINIRLQHVIVHESLTKKDDATDGSAMTDHSLLGGVGCAVACTVFARNFRL